MKHTKKLLAALLSLILVLSLVAPVMAEEIYAAPANVVSLAVNWDDFYIISQSPDELTVPFKSDFTLGVEVNIPAGAEVTYQWEYVIYGNLSSFRMENATEPVFHCSPGDVCYPTAPAARPYKEKSKDFFCTITAVEKDVNGNVVDTARLVTRGITVTVLPERDTTPREVFMDRWIIGPFWQTIGFCIGTYGLAIPIAPIIWLYLLIFYPIPF